MTEVGSTPTGFVWSEWTTPPEVLIPAQVDLRDAYHNGQAEAARGYDPVQLTNDALATVSPATLVNDPAYGVEFNALGSFRAHVTYPAGIERAEVAYRSQDRTAFWEEQPDFRAIPEHFANDGVFGQDVVGDSPVEGENFEFRPGPTQTVGWEPFFLLPYGSYSETTDAAHIVGSPHGERFTLTGSILPGPVELDLSRPVNVDSVSGNRWAVAGSVDVIALSPPPGPMTLALTTSLPAGFSHPVEGSWDPVDEVGASLEWWMTRRVGDYYLPTRPQIRLQLPDYRWKIPTFDTPRLPRFYVTYSEVDEDPRDVSHVVGIGKPADDLSVFRVPTPLGTLRELRHGEKVTDVSVAYPLKVKLEDGSWTVVAGMTPDD